MGNSENEVEMTKRHPSLDWILRRKQRKEDAYDSAKEETHMSRKIDLFYSFKSFSDLGAAGPAERTVWNRRCVRGNIQTTVGR